MTVVPGTRDVVAVRGADAVSFLQGQVSADVAGLGAGESTWSFLLQPTGKLGFWLRVTRPVPPGADGDGPALLLDVDTGLGEAVVARLQRFLLRVDATVETVAMDSATVVGGAGADLVDEATALAGGRDDVQVLTRAHPGPGGPRVVAVDLLGPVGSLDATAATGMAADLAAALVPVGWPSAAEMVEDSIPAELGQWVVDASVSFTKGCYTGQELVARVDSRGATTPYLLRVGVGDPGGPPVSPGDPVVHLGDDRGVVTSVAVVGGTPMALVRVHRSVPGGADVLLGANPATLVPDDEP